MNTKNSVILCVFMFGLCVLAQSQELEPEVETRTFGHLLGIRRPSVGSVAGGLIGSLIGGFLGAEGDYYGGEYAPGYGGGYGGSQFIGGRPVYASGSGASPFIGGHPVYPKRPSGYHRPGYPYDVNYYEYGPTYYNRPYLRK